MQVEGEDAVSVDILQKRCDAITVEILQKRCENLTCKLTQVMSLPDPVLYDKNLPVE